jgi:hypothetical protein
VILARVAKLEIGLILKLRGKEKVIETEASSVRRE